MHAVAWLTENNFALAFWECNCGIIRKKLFTCTSALANQEIHLLGVAKLKQALNLFGVKVHYGIFSPFSNFKRFYVILELYFLSFDESRYEVYWRYIKAFRPKNVNHSNFISFRNASLWNKLPITLRSLSTEATHANPVPFPPLALSHQQFLKHLKTHLVTLPFPP